MKVLPWIKDLLAAVLTRRRLVDMIAKSLFAQLLAAEATNEIFGITLQIFAIVRVSLPSIDED